MTNNIFSKTAVLFLTINIVVALATNAQAARNTPTIIDDKKKPDCIVDPDGSVLLPGLGRIMVPISGTASYHHPLVDSSPLPANDGSFPSPDGDTGASPLPDSDTGASPLPDGDTGASPLPDGDTGASPLPDGDTGATPLPDGDRN